MYNKNKFDKINDKKVLHKIKKHWVVVSLALLGVIGATGATTTVKANADNTGTPNDANHSGQLGTTGSNANSLVNTGTNTTAGRTSNSAENPADIQNQATRLAGRLLTHAANQGVAPDNLGATSDNSDNGQAQKKTVNKPNSGSNSSNQMNSFLEGLFGVYDVQNQPQKKAPLSTNAAILSAADFNSEASAANSASAAYSYATSEGNTLLSNSEASYMSAKLTKKNQAVQNAFTDYDHQKGHH